MRACTASSRRINLQLSVHNRWFVLVLKIHDVDHFLVPSSNYTKSTIVAEHFGPACGKAAE